MDEIEKLKQRIETLEKEQQDLRGQILKLSKLLHGQQRENRRKPQVIVGPSEKIRLPEIKPSKPRPGDPQCADRYDIVQD